MGLTLAPSFPAVPSDPFSPSVPYMEENFKLSYFQCLILFSYSSLCITIYTPLLSALTRLINKGFLKKGSNMLFSKANDTLKDDRLTLSPLGPGGPDIPLSPGIP